MVGWAYEFACDKSIAEMSSILNESGPWTWTLGESYWYGDYLKCRPSSDIRIRIHEPRHFLLPWLGSSSGVGEHYISQLEVGPEAGVQRSSIDAIFRELLARLPVQNLVEIDAYE